MKAAGAIPQLFCALVQIYGWVEGTSVCASDFQADSTAVQMAGAAWPCSVFSTGFSPLQNL
jgi:hypothetical protein